MPVLKNEKLLKVLKKKSPSVRKRKRTALEIKKEKLELKAFKEKILRKAKQFKVKTKLEKLMRKYNKLQKTWKGKAEFPKITWKTLQEMDFKPLKKNILDLTKQVEQSYEKMKGAMDYPFEYLYSKLESIIFTAIKNEVKPEIVDTLQQILNDPRFEVAGNSGKNLEINDLLDLIYDSIATGDDEETVRYIAQLYDLI